MESLESLESLEPLEPLELLVVMSGLELESPLVELSGRQVEMKGLLDPMAALLME